MNYAIIAAGEGSRLRQEGASWPKPLVPVMGEPMLGRLIALFHSMRAESISVICNNQSTEVADYLHQLSNVIPELHYVVQSTPSSMHSLAVLSDIIPDGRFCLTTVDTIFMLSDFKDFIEAAESDRYHDGLFAVTPFVDDEKPLWVGVESTLLCAEAGSDAMIYGFYDHEQEVPSGSCHLVSGGIYCLDTQTAFPVLYDCLQRGQSRMRNYQRALLTAGLHIKARIFPKILDIDHLEDVVKAEHWLASETDKTGKA